MAVKAAQLTWCGALAQVLNAAEEALRRLQVSGAERNAILDTLRYFDDLLQRSQRASQESVAAASTGSASAPAADVASERAAPAESSSSKPLTRWGIFLRVQVSRDESVALCWSVLCRPKGQMSGHCQPSIMKITSQC